jgi:hypothetical protein
LVVYNSKEIIFFIPYIFKNIFKLILISLVMLRSITTGFIITSMILIILIPLGDSFSQQSSTKNQTSSSSNASIFVVVAAENPETKSNLDRFNLLDLPFIADLLG